MIQVNFIRFVPVYLSYKERAEAVNQDTLAKIIANYKYTEEDMETVKKAGSIILPHLDEFSASLHEHIFTFDHAKAFIRTPEQFLNHKQKIEYWFTQVFSAEYTGEFYEYLNHINFVHKRIGLPSNYINSTFTFVRRFIRNRLHEAGVINYMDSVEKVLDLNLELLSTRYAGENFDSTLLMIRILRESLEEGFVTPYVQKIVSADTLTTSSYECLCRIDHPEHGLISPHRFLDIAKQIDMYGDITRCMFIKSFEVFKDRAEPFSINLSFLDISDTGTRAFINGMLSEYNPGRRLIIEIVETEQLADSEELYSFTEELKEHGVMIAIDDFGSGFSNFHNIDKIKPDYIKIDGSLIKDIDTNGINYAAVESIVDMSQKLGIATVAEYVHSERVMQTCRRLGVCKLQGFHISEPVSIARI